MAEQQKQLGQYDPNKPLPYKLSDEELGLKKYTSHDEKWDEESYIYRDALQTFLNEQVHPTENGLRPTMDEYAFVNYWLPKLYNGNPGRKDIDQGIAWDWVRQVSGSYYSPVDVTREGKVIFTIPPMIGRLEPIGAMQRNVSFHQRHKNMENTVSRVPQALNVQLRHLVHNMFDTKDGVSLVSRSNLKYIYVMDEIFTYYGYDTILTPELMQVKHLFIKTAGQDGTQSSGTVQSNDNHPAEQYTGDDDLF